MLVKGAPDDILIEFQISRCVQNYIINGLVFFKSAIWIQSKYL